MNAAKPPEGGPDQRLATKQAQDQGNATGGLHGYFGRHSYWACFRRSHQVAACPRCCVCLTEERCTHPEYGQWITEFEYLGEAS